MSVKVRMLSLAAGPSGVFPAGTIRDVTDDEALVLVDGGYAEFVASAPPAEKPVEEEIETAMAAPPETTTKRTGKPKGRVRR